MRQVIGYGRVSTTHASQDQSIDGQERQIRDACERQGASLVAFYSERESGGRSNRPELLKALEHVRRVKGELWVADLSRLSRQMSFVNPLLESGVPFKALDMPEANTLLIQIMTAINQHYRDETRRKIRLGLAAAKARGTRLGVNAVALAQSHKRASVAFAETLRGIVSEIRKSGIITVQGVCDELNARNVRSREGKAWHYSNTWTLLRRLGS